MANTTQNSPNGFTVLSQFLFKLFMNILILGVIAFLMSLIASVAYTKLPQKWLDVLASPFTWITQNPWLALAIFIIFLLLIAIFYLMSRSSGSVAEPSQTVRVEFVPPPPPAPVPLAPTPKLAPTERELALAYCNHINKRNERLEHDGIPAGLVDRRVKLEDVFIPLRFYRLDAPRDIFPYMDADLAHVRRERELVAQQGGDIRAYNRIIELARQEGDFKPDKTIDIATLWQCMTPHEPMAFIEGIPGMGKSTLLTRIMLYMARRVQNIADPDMPALAPILIPVFVSLKKYATERNTPTNKLSLLDFIKTDIREKFHDRDEVDALIAFIERQLKSGYCLVLIDGIDEVSDPAMRQTVQVAIKDFIERRQEKATATYNRFLITSRVAGYDKKGFEDYPHYLIARLTLEQMKDFLPRWCHANVSRDMRDESEEDIRREADEITQILIKTVENNAPVRELAEIPLLLTLLAALQQKGATLPDRCAGLYKLVVNTLLTDRNKAKKLETLSVADAHQRLGPLVYEMHTHNSLALDEDYIHQKLAEAIHAQQGKSQQTPIDASEEMEAKSYLNRLSERGGLFVKRAGNYYDFSHRSFEEYFTAQYLLRQIELNQQEGIQDFIERIVHNYSLWREPYLLAVASKSENDSTTGGTTASKLIQALLQSPLTSTDLNLLLLTATAIIEAEPNSIDLTLQRQIADVLLKRYTEALRAKKFEDCKRIEQTMTRWLLTLPKDAFRPPVLLSLLDHILNAS